MRQRLIRPVVTILLLMVCLVLPLTPGLAAMAANAQSAHACCLRKGRHCCPPSDGTTGGASWTAGRECGGNCAMLGPVVPIPGAVAARAGSAIPVPPIEKSAGSAALRDVEQHHFPWLRQRPPPAC